MFSRPDHARDEGGRGGWLLAGNRDPHAIYQHEFNRLAALATKAQHAHIKKKKLNKTKLIAGTSSSSSSSSPPPPPSSSSSSSSPSSTSPFSSEKGSCTSSSTDAPKNPYSNLSNKNKKNELKKKYFPFNSRPLSDLPEDRAHWLGWHSGLDAFTVFPLSPAKTRASLNMQDYMEHEDPEDAGDYRSIEGVDVLLSPPIPTVPQATTTVATTTVATTTVATTTTTTNATVTATLIPTLTTSKLGKERGVHIGVTPKKNNPDNRIQTSHTEEVAKDCTLCGLSVFKVDRTDVLGYVYCKECFGCSRCKRMLTSWDAVIKDEGVLMCTACEKGMVASGTPVNSPHMKPKDDTNGMVKLVNESNLSEI
jgi:hypothetical protein